ncbi:cyclic dehypoxanthinyl futalosine synthase [Desulfoluna spongiiphila]|uniref:cyclic dehypoxanthinyl futalosine synthase n=1 Tax=Desulfoluna spongiiphila TaxID=419481 RepID=UPI001251BF0C|nr:cyclic dehypoxanthinyl futalosine synthase [Desulfoluna spongiiphila]VVS91882.1 fo synthase subunit 2 [Desulfoluna spongiiphila]
MESLSEKISFGYRVTPQELLELSNGATLSELGALAHAVRLAKHPDPTVTFVVDRNINYTNVCTSECKFCAFYSRVGEDGGYVLSRESFRQKIEETLELGGTQILLQGGMNPALTLDWYVDLLRWLTTTFPIHVHGFSPPEISWLADQSQLSIAETVEKLKEAGLKSIPGGGAEILVDEVRRQVSPNKCGVDKWLEVMRQAHLAGMRSTATMMFGHLETPAQIVEHLTRIRDLQDETGGFTAFIPWTFQPTNTYLDVEKATADAYLRVLALSRIFLDNVDNIQASWVTQGEKIAQVALFFGANDMGSTMIEENVVSAAGVDHMLPKEELIRVVASAGFTPVQRDCFYNHLAVCA